MTDTDTLPFTGAALDHAEPRRSNAELKGFLDHPSAKVILLRHGAPAISDEGWLITVHPSKLIGRQLLDPGPLFLGLKNDEPYFVAGLDSGAELALETQFNDMRLAAARLHPEELAIAGRGKSLLDWHQDHQYCAKCGKRSQSGQGGIIRYCPACETQHFPRVNPVVIMMVLHEDECLLGRAANWPDGAYSALAGFVSPGETLEEACIREVKEEVGLDVSDVTYVMSQPWPFPSQLMMGVTCRAQGKKLTINTDEIENARWFSRETVAAVYAKESEAFLRPPRMAVAHHLIKHWLNLN